MVGGSTVEGFAVIRAIVVAARYLAVHTGQLTYQLLRGVAATVFQAFCAVGEWYGDIRGAPVYNVLQGFGDLAHDVMRLLPDMVADTGEM